MQEDGVQACLFDVDLPKKTPFLLRSVGTLDGRVLIW